MANQNIEGIYNLTPLQEGMYFYAALDAGSGDYVIQNRFRLGFALDREKLTQALQLLILKHKALRTGFIATKDGDKVFQVVLRQRKPELRVEELGGLDPAEQERIIDQVCAEDVDRGFRLDSDSLIRFYLFPTGEARAVLVSSFHHIIMDGWCIHIVMADFLRIYRELSGGAAYETLLAQIRAQSQGGPSYTDYLQWLSKQDRELAYRYWASYLEDYGESADLPPLEKPAPTEQTVAKLQRFCDPALTAAIEASHLRNHVTVSTILEAAWGLLLAKYHRASDAVFGKVVSGRNPKVPGVERMVGLFINTIPRRVRTEPETTGRELLERLQQEAAAASQYDYASLAEIQGRHPVGRDLVRALYVFQNFFVSEEDRAQVDQALDAEQIGEREQTNYDISLEPRYDEDRGLLLKLIYDPRVYTEAQCRRVLGHLEQILSALVNRENEPVSAIVPSSPQEEGLILGAFNATEDESLPIHQTLQALFEAQVRRSPEAVAVIDGERCLRYRELNERANRLARRLRRLGVKPNSFVAFVAHRSLELEIGIFGILKAGGAYVPIDPEYPRDRIEYMIGDCQPAAVLTALYEPVDFDAPCPVLDLFDPESYDEDGTDLPNLNRPSDYSHCFYTSGTTGKPKGAINCHGGLINRIFWAQAHCPIGPGDTMLQKTVITFDDSLSELLWWSFVGARVVMLPVHGEKDPAQMIRAIETHGVTVMFFVPTVLSYFDQLLEKETPGAVRTLRWLFTSGEEIKPQLLEQSYRLLELAGADCKIYNVYGPTECSVDVTGLYCPRGMEHITIGRPMSNTRAYVLRGNALCGIGVPGELCVSGVHVGAGYLNRPELTAEKFCPDPWTGAPMYRTGDLCAWLPDGSIDFMGRMDEQIKIRGQRVELGEIESALQQIPGLRESAVIARTDKKGEKYLCAYYVTDRELSPESLRQQLRALLPDYMVPGAMMRLEKLPNTRTGKLDLKALPEPDSLADSGYEAPRTEAERAVCAAFGEVLDLPRVGIHDDFFALGGHSLRATRLVNLIEAKTGTRLALKEIFATPTPVDLAGKLDGTYNYIPIPQAQAAEAYPMSSTQRRLYLLDELDGTGLAYHIPVCLAFSGQAEPEKLQAAFQSLVDRHEVLRTTFRLDRGQPLQRILPQCRAELEQISLPTGSRAEAEAAFRAFVRPFDLGSAPLARLGLAQGGGKGYLLFDMHHIISDGMSMNILIEEFGKLCAGEPLQPLRVQYKDYAAWMGSRDLSAQGAFWKAQFADGVPVLDLPTDFPRPQVQSFRGSRIATALEPKLTQALGAYCAKTGMTEYMVLLGGLMLTLSRYARQEDIVVGSPISGRVHKDTETMLGMFANTLPLRAYPAGEKRVRVFLGELRKLCLGAYENQEYAMDDLIEDLSLRRDTGRNPLFDVALALQNNENAELRIPGLRLEGELGENKTSKFDLSFSFRPEGDGMVLDTEYSTDLFREETVRRMNAHYLRALTVMLQNPDSRLEELSLVSEEEALTITHSFNDTARPYPSEETVMGLFQAQAARTPEAPAVLFGEDCLSYGVLNRQANAVAARLKALGIGREDIVGILAEKSVRTVAGILGILKAGAAYLPMDLSYPPERMAFLLADSQAKALLCDKERPAFETELPVLVLDGAQAEDNPPIETGPRDLAYVIYTSGTTGKPKGAMIEQRSILRLVCDPDYVDLRQARILQTGALAFDASTFELYGALLNGGTVVLAPKETLLDAGAFRAALERYEINTVFLTTALFNQLLSTDEGVFDGLRTLLFGGEKSSEQYVRLLADRGTVSHFCNVYGPTETTTFAAWFPIDGVRHREKTPIGRPISNTRAYVMEGGKLCGIGVPGELCIAGPGVARGYLNRPELTAEKFTQDPFGEGLLYHSGDLVRRLEDGNLEFLGRMDQQVKIRGFRIEPGEVQTALRNLEGVEDAAVVVHEEGETRSLWAYVVGPESLDPEALRRSLSARMPDYMIPAGIMRLERLPVNRNGKLDRAALPEMQIRAGADDTAPETELQASLCQCFAEILELPRVGIHDDFFALGGHSLRAVRLVNLIESRLGVRPLVKDVFTAPTPAALALRMAPAGEDYQPIPAAPAQESYPLSSPQKRLYYIARMDEQSTAYNIPYALELKGKLDLDRAEAALQALIARHEALRTSFCMEGEEPRQRIAPQAQAHVELEQAAGLSREALLARYQAFVRPFDLGKAPLMRVRVLQTGPESALLLFDMHHIISDGMSMGIVVREFSQLYQGVSLSPLRVQYKDYACWMAQRDLGAQAAFWQGQFAEPAPVLELPTDFPRAPVQSFRGGLVHAELDEAFTQTLDGLREKTGCTDYMLFLAGLMITLARLSRQEDIVVGTAVSGRTHRDTESMLGMFVNTLAMRGFPSPEKSGAAFLEEIKALSLAAFENQDYPFEELIEAVEPRRDMGRSPLFDVMMTVQNNETAALDLGQTSLRQLEDQGPVSAKFDLTFAITRQGNRYTVAAEYCADLFLPETVRRQIAHLAQVLRELAQGLEAPIGSLCLCDEAERAAILGPFNDTARPYPSEETVMGLFQAQAARTPEAPAVLFGEDCLSYQALNRQANAVAARLKALGIGREDIVGILAEKSVRTVAGILGILKAGAAYLPMDLSYPPERMAFLLADSQAKALLCDKERPAFETELPVLVLDGTQAEDNPPIETGPRDLAYVIYTSGTTGKPKGAMIEQRSILRLVCDPDYVDLRQARILQTGALAFDASTFELYGALLNGGTVVLAPKETLLDAGAFRAALERYEINTVFLTTALFNQLLSTDEGVFDGLRTLLFGGEKSSEQYVRLLADRGTVSHFCNVYGPTETTTFAAWFPIDGIRHREKTPIGRPVSNTRAYVMEGGKLCGIGVPGELCIAGPGVARGYLNRPELTAEKFTQDPFGEGLLYHSGDLVRRLEDGNLEFLGRMDQQVKIRGFRIEPGEVQTALRNLEGVEDAAVVVHEEGETRSLWAYVVGPESLDPEALRRSLSAQMPDYMIPAGIMRLERLPVNRNGKLDRAALPEMQIRAGADDTAPESPAQKAVAEALEAVLGLERVGLHDSFFDLGGDSIKAIRAVSMLRSMGFEASVRSILQGRTVERIALELKPSQAQAVDQGPVTGPAPLSPVQRRFFDWKLPVPAHFNQAFLFHSPQGFEEQALRRALDALCLHHDMLRAVYEGGVQRLRRPEEGPHYALSVFDWRDQPQDRALARRVEAQNSAIQASMDLERGPLFRLGLYHLADGDHLLLSLHHLVVDGVSWRVLLEDFESAYSQALSGREIRLPRKTASFPDWVRALEELGSRLGDQPEAALWREIAAQAPAGALPEGHSAASGFGLCRRSLDRSLSETLLYRAGAAYGTQLQELLLSALALAVRQRTGQELLTVDLEGHGRVELPKPLAVDRTVGWFTSIYPVVLSASEDVEQTIIDTKELLRRIPRQGLGFGLLARQPDSGLDRVRVELSFNYLGDFDTELLQKRQIVPSPYSPGAAVAPENPMPTALTVGGSLYEGQLRFELIFDRSRFTQAQVEALGDAYLEALALVARTCTGQAEQVRTLSDLGDEELDEGELEELNELFDAEEEEELF